MPTTRRTFIKQVGATTLLAAVPFPASSATSETSNAASAMPVSPAVPLRLTINGTAHEQLVEPRVVLLDFLRETLGLTGAKKGCDHGQCGACTVLVNGRRIKSCLSLAVMHDGDNIMTIEGLEKNGALHPMQTAFLDHDGYQCGYCTAGQIMSAVALTHEPIGKDDAAVREAMSGNICRCGAYQGICAAIQSARGHA
jgi:xanthine dehydrogenase YagT iron-sulfur-binding subunit